MGLKVDREYGEDLKVIHILVNGKMVKHKDMEFIHGLMETDMKDNLNNVLNMDKEYKNLQMVICTKDTTRMVSLMGKENISGTMVALTKVTLCKDFVLVREHGENPTILVLILIRVNSLTKKNKVMECLYGQMEANI